MPGSVASPSCCVATERNRTAPSISSRVACGRTPTPAPFWVGLSSRGAAGSH
jgi:hypothetical protein